MKLPIKTNNITRIKLVKAMEFIVSNINDEEIAYEWIVDGVADGDIEYGNLEVMSDDEEYLSYYLEDDNFADLMNTFLRLMVKAKKSGGLYCDYIVSKRNREDK